MTTTQLILVVLSTSGLAFVVLGLVIVSLDRAVRGSERDTDVERRGRPRPRHDSTRTS